MRATPTTSTGPVASVESVESIEPEPDWLAPGRVLGRFEIRERLGEGGMGVVVTALDPKLGRMVAIKVLHVDPAPGAASAARQRLPREARAMAKLAHPSVVAVHEVEVFT